MLWELLVIVRNEPLQLRREKQPWRDTRLLPVSGRIKVTSFARGSADAQCLGLGAATSEQMVLPARAAFLWTGRNGKLLWRKGIENNTMP